MADTPTPTSSPAVGRRRFLATAAGATAALLVTDRIPGAWAVPRAATDDPFTLGVASGDPTPTGVVLWTRLAPRPLDPDGGMPALPVPVDWEVATGPRMIDVVARGRVVAAPSTGHAATSRSTGWLPAATTGTGFRAGGHTSRLGRTKTCADPGAPLERLALAVVCCQSWESGYYTAYRHLAEEDLDVVLHLGDYIYEYGSRPGLVRRHVGAEPTDLAGYRVRHALYKTDPDLQAAHARHPFVTAWDDHEVENDHAGRHPVEGGDPGRVPSSPRGRLPGLLGAPAAAAAATRSEHADVPAAALRRPDRGQHARHPPVPRRPALRRPRRGWRRGRHLPGAARPAPHHPRRPAAALAAARPGPLGRALERARPAGGHGRAGPASGPGRSWWSDAWDGYAADRQRILRALWERQPANPIVLTGDIHSFFVNDLRLSNRDPGSPAVATEFVGTSISSGAGKFESFVKHLRANPHVRFFDNRRRGYTRCTVIRQRWYIDLRVVDTVKRPGAGVRTLASFVVEDSRPGAERV